MSLHLEREINILKKRILRLGALVEEQLERAMTSILTRDVKLANQVIEQDNVIDEMEVEVEEECLKILALHQPVAIDLRFIVAVLKMDGDLERLGDIAVHIAKRGARVTELLPARAIPREFSTIAERVRRMVRACLDALVNFDATTARGVCEEDAMVDKQCREMYDHVKAMIQREPEQLDGLIELVMIPRHLERIADHATNIAEDLIYMIEGRIVRHQR
ncbi:MAG: phosphate signaling complex protein PhoU [bacterium]|nr:phosphate signaling complex protein PhoU [bacterium]